VGLIKAFERLTETKDMAAADALLAQVRAAAAAMSAQGRNLASIFYKMGAAGGN
jgi:hypothetical protein